MAEGIRAQGKGAGGRVEEDTDADDEAGAGVGAARGGAVDGVVRGVAGGECDMKENKTDDDDNNGPSCQEKIHVDIFVF